MSTIRSVFLRLLSSTLCRATLSGLALPLPALAQEPLSLGRAVRLAGEETPASAEDQATLALSRARVAAARAATLPELGVSVAGTLGTGNVVAGGLFAPGGFPSVSGPPAEVSLAPGWQAQGGSALRWDLLGLLGRVRDVGVALAEQERDEARVAARRQERSVAAGFAWLAMSEAQQALEVARADVERARRVLVSAQTLAEAGVRPGVERALAASELALAEQRLARAEGEVAATGARLIAALGGEAALIEGGLAAPPEEPPPSVFSGTPPILTAGRAELLARQTGIDVARLAFLPHLSVAGAAWYRAGVWPEEVDLSRAPNWASGVVVDLPLLDLPERVSAVRAARAARDVAQSRLEGLQDQVEGQHNEAEALLSAAVRADTTSHIVVGAARAAREQAEARYEAGLIEITIAASAVAKEREAQLAALSARFDVLRAALIRDYARGDLSAWEVSP